MRIHLVMMVVALIATDGRVVALLRRAPEVGVLVLLARVGGAGCVLWLARVCRAGCVLLLCHGGRLCGRQLGLLLLLQLHRKLNPETGVWALRLALAGARVAAGGAAVQMIWGWLSLNQMVLMMQVVLLLLLIVMLLLLLMEMVMLMLRMGCDLLLRLIGAILSAKLAHLVRWNLVPDLVAQRLPMVLVMSRCLRYRLICALQPKLLARRQGGRGGGLR